MLSRRAVNVFSLLTVRRLFLRGDYSYLLHPDVVSKSCCTFNDRASYPEGKLEDFSYFSRGYCYCWPSSRRLSSVSWIALPLYTDACLTLTQRTFHDPPMGQTRRAAARTGMRDLRESFEMTCLTFHSIGIRRGNLMVSITHELRTAADVYYMNPSRSMIELASEAVETILSTIK